MAGEGVKEPFSTLDADDDVGVAPEGTVADAVDEAEGVLSAPRYCDLAAESRRSASARSCSDTGAASVTMGG